jgi:hypothetical protein
VHRDWHGILHTNTQVQLYAATSMSPLVGAPAGVNGTGRHLVIANYQGTSSGMALYYNGVGSALATNTNANLPPSSLISRFMASPAGDGSDRLIGEMGVHVVYANTALTGTGELQALYDALDARW